MYTFCCISFLFLILVHGTFTLECAKRISKYGIICVCNATYCDTIEPIGQIPSGQYVEYTTTKKGKRLERTVRSFWDVTNENAIKMTVDPGNTFQRMFGFGGSLTDSTLFNIHKYSEDIQNSFLRSYFGDEGLEWEMLRIPIGGTDFSDRPYSYDDGPPDPELKNFNLTAEDYFYRIPFLKKVKQLQSNLKLSACAWSAPAWMKTNKHLCEGRLLPKYYQTFTDYLMKYLEFYHHYGIDMWALSTINEPIMSPLPVFHLNSMAMSYDVMGLYISKYLGPTLRQSSFSNLKLLTFEEMRPFIPWWIDEMLKNNTALDYIDGFAIHSYLDGLGKADVLTELQMKYPDKFIFFTEVAVAPGDMWTSRTVKLGDWYRAVSFIERSIENINNWATGFLDWNMVGNMNGGPTWNGNSLESTIVVEPEINEFYKQPLYYAIGHMSKFIREGDMRIFHSLPKVEGLHVMSLKRVEDDRITLVFLNTLYEKRYISIQRDQDNRYLNIIVDPFSFKTVIYYA